MRAAETFSAEPWRDESVPGKSSRCAVMTTSVPESDLDAAKTASRAHLEGCANTICCKRPGAILKCLGVVRHRHLLVSWSASHSERSQRRSWRTLWNLVSVRSVSAPLLRHLIPKYCMNNRVILKRAISWGVCCFCHVEHVSTSPLLVHGSQGLSHAGANGLEKK